MEILQQIVNGLAQGSIYALIALGYTMVYGVLRLINFAHGDIYMLGAFGGFFAANWLGVTRRINEGGSANLVYTALIFLFSMLACAVAGMLMERLAYRPLRQAPRLTALITAIGISMLLEYGGQAVFTPDPQSFPALIPGTTLIDTPTFTLTLVQVAVVTVALALMLLLQFIVFKTPMGRAMRAVSLDRAAASLMGINTDVVIAFTFALGSALAAAAGILNSVYQPSIDPLMGVMAGLKAFVAAVLGGIGSIPGAVLGGLLLGFAETLVSATQYSQYRDAIAFAVLIGVLLLRPAGLLGRVTAEKV
ncbi:MAG TPA: branched-chain amino acid ABC transporter permease [Abditibacteriaceae bacterium]|jgi:branched-chain amino acid transport system permease protein